MKLIQFGKGFVRVNTIASVQMFVEDTSRGARPYLVLTTAGGQAITEYFEPRPYDPGGHAHTCDAVKRMQEIADWVAEETSVAS